ncbi:unnamed protein product [Prunus armeniaca]
MKNPKEKKYRVDVIQYHALAFRMYIWQRFGEEICQRTSSTAGQPGKEGLRLILRFQCAAAARATCGGHQPRQAQRQIEPVLLPEGH